MIRKGLTKKEKKQASEEAKIFLKKNIKENEVIYYVVTHVSQSGMHRHIKFFYYDGERNYNLSGYFSDLLDYKWIENGSIGVGGCGMDMGFHVISQVASTLFDDYKKLKYEAI